MRLYLDTSPIIYLIEQRQPFASAVRARLAMHAVQSITSELARLECRVKPIQVSDAILLQDYDQYFAHTIAEIIPLTRNVVDLATEIRAKYNFKTPDSLHLAAAVSARCDVFLTNDFRLNRFTEFSIQVV